MKMSNSDKVLLENVADFLDGKISLVGSWGGRVRELIDRMTAAEPTAPPLVDREALAEAVRPFVDQFDGNATSRKYLCADALLTSGILRPMPTRDEIAITLIETRLWKGAWASAGETERDIFYQQADAILALIEGAKP